MDYLDKMIEAEEKEFALWYVKSDPTEDVFEVWRDKCLIEKKPGHMSFAKYRDRYIAMRKRFAMEAAYLAAREYATYKSASTKAFLDKVNQTKAGMLLFDEPRSIVIKSRMHDKDVAGMITEQREPIKFVTKITVKPKIDWLALNREMSA